MSVWLCSLACGAAEAQDDLHVISYNIRWAAPSDGPHRWEHRRAAVRDFLTEQGADLAALQEITPAQLEDLAPGLRGQLLWSVRSQVAAVVGPRATVRRAEVHPLPGGEYPRGAVIAEIEVQGRTLTFVSAHLSGDAAGRAQAEALLAALAPRPRPWVLAGDFNAYPLPPSECRALPPRYHVLCNGAYDRLITAGFTDPLVALLGVAPRSTATGFQAPEARWMPGFDARIDWVLVTEELTPIDAWIGDPVTTSGRPLSDHRPVHVRLRFAPEAPSAPEPAEPGWTP